MRKKALKVVPVYNLLAKRKRSRYGWEYSAGVPEFASAQKKVDSTNEIDLPRSAGRAHLFTVQLILLVILSLALVSCLM